MNIFSLGLLYIYCAFDFFVTGVTGVLEKEGFCQGKVANGAALLNYFSFGHFGLYLSTIGN